MDGMHGALKQRRGGLLNDMEENAHQMPEKEQSGEEMKSLVMSLSDDQKQELLGILEADVSQGPGDAMSIQRGGAGPGERIDVAMESDGYDLGGDHESEEEIGESLMSSADKMRADQGVSGRNLGERVRINLAKKQKNKR